jgi:hypothetical protein
MNSNAFTGFRWPKLDPYLLLLYWLEQCSACIEHGELDDAENILKICRDQALRSLNDREESGIDGQGRELMHDISLLATVQLSKLERGDYG